MLELGLLESIVSQDIKLEMAMFYVNTFFVIVSMQFGYLILTLIDEANNESAR